MFPILETDTSSCPALEHKASLTHRNNQDHKLASQPAARTNKVRILDIMKIIMWNLQSELEVLSIFKSYWDIGILGTVQACTVLNIARLRMLKCRYWRY